FGDGEASYTYDDFGPCYDTIENWDDKEEVQNCELLDLADLDTGSSHVQDQIVRYLNNMIDLGVGGFRVDATKHIPEEHVEAIFAQLDDVPGWGGQPHVYHEVIGDDTVPYTNYTDYGQITNFDYQRDVANRFADGNIAELTDMDQSGDLTPAAAVLSIANHDAQRRAPTLTSAAGDAYSLATAFTPAPRSGTPVVMSSYAFQGNDAEGPPSSGAVEGNPAGWVTEDT